MELEYKSGTAEFKAGAADGDYEGYFAVCGNVDDGGDCIEAGAFKKTLAERGAKVRVFWGHDPLRPIGPPPGTIVEDSHGLYVKGRLTVDSFWGREAWLLLKDGALTEGSIGYRSIPARTEWKDGVRHLYELKLFEVSFVSIGMNSETGLRAMKSAAGGATPPALYLEILGLVAGGLKSVPDGALDTATARNLSEALGLAQKELDARLGAAAAPADVMTVSHTALQLRERADRLGLTLVQ